MFRLTLNQGYCAFIDDEDAPLALKQNWFIKSRVGRLYAFASFNGVQFQLSNFVMKAVREILIDHKNGDVLDCQKANLRICSQKQNTQNSIIGRYPNKTSKFKGVRKYSPGIWLASICGQKIGSFYSEHDAARAYDKAAIERYGEFAKTNEMIGIFEGKDPHEERKKLLETHRIEIVQTPLVREEWNDKLNRTGEIERAYRCHDGKLLRFAEWQPEL
jgi:hypothetical protein